MVKFLLWSIGFAVLLFAYLRWVRPYLKSLPSFAEHYAEEERLWDAFKEWLKGRRTILIGMWGEVIAWGPDLLQLASGWDFKALFHLPDAWAVMITALIPILMIIFRAKADPPEEA